MRKIIFFIFAIIACSCASHSRFKSGAKIQKLGVKLTYNETNYKIFKERYSQQLDIYIAESNSKKGQYYLYRTENADSCAVELKIERVNLASGGKQLACFGLSICGVIGLPAAIISAQLPFIAFVWFVPKNKSYVKVKFSSDLFMPEIAYYETSFQSGAYFGGKEAQISKHSNKIYKNYEKFFKGIAVMYAAHKRIEEYRVLHPNYGKNYHYKNYQKSNSHGDNLYD